MQASIEKLEGLKRLLTVTVPAEDVKKAYDTVLRRTAKTARIDGFRKGHIPPKVLETYYGAGMIGEAYDMLVRQTLEDALKEGGDAPAGTPNVSFEKSSYDKNGELVYTAAFETFPVIEDKPLSEITIKVVQSKVTEEDIDKMVSNLRSQQAKWQVVDDAAAENGKLVKIDFVGRVDGVPFEHGSAQDFSLHLGRTAMIPGFSEGIIGHKAGDKFTIQVTFPEDYHEESLKGKPAEFDITVNSVSEQVLPELNADFFKLYGVEDGTEETFRKDLRDNMEREQKRLLISLQRQNVCEALLKAFGKFEVPECLVEAERKSMCEREVERYKTYHLPVPHDPYEDPEHLKEPAADSVRLGLICSHYVEKSGLRAPSDASIDEFLSMIADAYEDPEMVRNEIKKDSQNFARVRQQAFDRDLFNYIQNSAKCEVEEKTFADLMNFVE